MRILLLRLVWHLSPPFTTSPSLETLLSEFSGRKRDYSILTLISNSNYSRHSKSLIDLQKCLQSMDARPAQRKAGLAPPREINKTHRTQRGIPLFMTPTDYAFRGRKSRNIFAFDVVYRFFTYKSEIMFSSKHHNTLEISQ